MKKLAKVKIALKDIRHNKGIYYKERQAVDMATLMLRGFSQQEAYELVNFRYK